MAEQPPVPETVTPEQFFEQLMPMGYQAQVQSGDAVTPADMTLQFHVTGPGGGDWHLRIAGGDMKVTKGNQDAAITITVGIDDWRDAVLGRNGAALNVLVPQNRPGRPDNSARAKALKGTMALDLARDGGGEPFKVELCFNGSATPRTLIKMKLPDYVAMQDGRLNGQEAFMTGKLRVEGDMAFLMQIAALTA